jgi:hypothetical protein
MHDELARAAPPLLEPVRASYGFGLMRRPETQLGCNDFHSFCFCCGYIWTSRIRISPGIWSIKMKMIYNNTNKLDRLLSNGHQMPSHLVRTLKSKDWAGYSSTMYTYRHTYLQCVPTFLWVKNCKKPQ